MAIREVTLRELRDSLDSCSYSRDYGRVIVEGDYVVGNYKGRETWEHWPETFCIGIGPDNSIWHQDCDEMVVHVIGNTEEEMWMPLVEVVSLVVDIFDIEPCNIVGRIDEDGLRQAVCEFV